MSRITRRLDGAYETFMEHLNEAEYDDDYTREEFVTILKDRFGSRIANDYPEWFPNT